MTRRSWIITLAALALPFQSIAAPSSFLSEGDAEAWRTFAGQVGADADAYGREMEFQLDGSLFPGGETGPSPGTSPEFVTVTVDGRPLAFADVPVREWFAPYVRSIAERGIISGYRSADGIPLGSFGPADSVTLEQVAKVALYAAGADVSSCETEIPNPSATAWAVLFVTCAQQSQWSAYSDSTVDVTRPATRAEVVATVLQAFAVQTGNIGGETFTDVGSSTLYAAAIERAAKDGIVNGYADAAGHPTGAFGPDDAVNRAEFAKIVTLALEVYGE